MRGKRLIAVLVSAALASPAWAGISFTFDFLETSADGGGYVSSPEQPVFVQHYANAGVDFGSLWSDLTANSLTVWGGSSLEAGFDGQTLGIDARLNGLQAELTDTQYGGVFAQGQAYFQMWLHLSDTAYEYTCTVQQDYSDGLVGALRTGDEPVFDLFAVLDGVQGSQAGARGSWYDSGLLAPGDYLWYGGIQAAALSTGPDTGVLGGLVEVRAYLMPVPTDYTWIGTNGGQFSTALFWNPLGPPGPDDRAVFNSPAAGDEFVTFDSSVTNARVLVTAPPEQASSLIALDLGGHTYTLTREWNRDNRGSVLVGDANTQSRMMIVNGTMDARDAEIGLYGYGELTASTDAVYLADQHMMSIGGFGSGVVNVHNGAWVQHGHGYAGTYPGGQGTINVNGVHPVTPGAASTWFVTGWFGLGTEGQGALNVSNGGLAMMSKCDMGIAEGAVATASISGTDARWQLLSSWEPSLIVGQRGQASVEVSNGGTLHSEGEIYLGETTTGRGAIRLRQRGTSDGIVMRPTLSGMQRMVVGKDGAGTLELSEAARAEIWGALLVGTDPALPPEEGSGVFVSGADSSLDILGYDGEGSVIGLEVGRQGSGNLLSVTEGGWVSSRYATTIGGAQGSGVLSVDGDGSVMDVRYTFEAGRDAPGNVLITNGGRIAVSGSTDAPDLPEGNKGLAHIGVRSDGQLNVIGRGPHGPSMFESNAQLSLGIQENLGYGVMNVEQGGLVVSWKHTSPTNTAGIVARTPGSTGYAIVRDADSRWEMPDGGLTVGWYGSGRLNILDGGVVTSEHGIIGRMPGSTGEVHLASEVDGLGSHWAIGGGLSIGGDLTGAAGGNALLRIGTRGVVHATGSAEVYPGGTVELADGYLGVEMGTTLHGICTGFGSIFGSVVNVDGWLSLGDLSSAPYWDISLDGSYTQQSGGTMEVEVFGDGAVGRLTAWNGAVALDGRLKVTIKPGVVPPVDSTYEIINAANGVTGQFTAYDLPTVGGQPVFDVVYDVNTVTLIARIEYRCRADFNGDLDVDAEDLGIFNECVSGPMVPYAEGCAARDFNGDGCVDQRDFAVLQRCFSGEGTPADPGCMG